MFVQFTVDNFAEKCTSLARNLNSFINIIQQEDISLLDNYDCMREVDLFLENSFLYIIPLTISLRLLTRTEPTTDNSVPTSTTSVQTVSTFRRD